MLDFSVIQNSSENPTALSIALTVMFSFVLSALVTLVYDLTTNAINRPRHFLQSLAMVSIVAATVMQAVGDSLARGLGMLGALAIIRFRTTLRNPRNMTFMFASLAVGIACGTNGYVIAIIGTFAFCFVAILLRFSPFHDSQQLIGNLKFKILIDDANKAKVDEIIKRNTKDHSLKLYQYDTKKEVIVKNTNIPPQADAANAPVQTAPINQPNLNDPNVSLNEAGDVVIKRDVIAFQYLVSLKKVEESAPLMNELMAVDGISNVRLSFNESSVDL